MKKTKILRVLTIIMALCLMSVAFIGCDDEDKNPNASCVVVLGNAVETAYTVELDNVSLENGLLSILDYLKENESLDYECDTSGYLTRVGDVAQDTSAGRYIYIYTSEPNDQDVSQYATTITYNGSTLVSTGVGAKDMTISNNTIIYIGTIVWQ